MTYARRPKAATLARHQAQLVMSSAVFQWEGAGCAPAGVGAAGVVGEGLRPVGVKSGQPTV